MNMMEQMQNTDVFCCFLTKVTSRQTCFQRQNRQLNLGPYVPVVILWNTTHQICRKMLAPHQVYSMPHKSFRWILLCDANVVFYITSVNTEKLRRDIFTFRTVSSFNL